MATLTVTESLARAAIASDPRRFPEATVMERRCFDRAFRSLLETLHPRFRHMINRWGLAQHYDDALQAAHIGVYKALESFDPAVAQFSTHVNFRLQAQMKDLRFRLFRDERSDAVKVGARTISANLPLGDDDAAPQTLIDNIADETALAATETTVAELLAGRISSSLLDRFERDEQSHRRVIDGVEGTDAAIAVTRAMRHCFELLEVQEWSVDEVAAVTGMSRERLRQVVAYVRTSLARICREDPGSSLRRTRPEAIAKIDIPVRLRASLTREGFAASMPRDAWQRGVPAQGARQALGA